MLEKVEEMYMCEREEKMVSWRKQTTGATSLGVTPRVLGGALTKGNPRKAVDRVLGSFTLSRPLDRDDAAYVKCFSPWDFVGSNIAPSIRYVGFDHHDPRIKESRRIRAPASERN